MRLPTGRARLGALTLVTLLVLAACSGDDETTADPSETPPATAAPDAPGAPDAADATSGGGSNDQQTARDGQEPDDETTDGPTPDAPVEITIAASGDVLPHSWVNVSARIYAGSEDRSMYPTDGDSYDYTPMFADIADLVAGADLALCHLETPLSPDNTDLSYPNTLSFNTPHEMADALAGAGYDGCDFASNHTMDRGIQGVADTEEVLRGAGMGYAGPTAHEDRAGQAEVYEVATDSGGVARVGHLAYTYTYPNSGSPTTYIPQEAPWLEQAHWPTLGSAGILEQAQAAREGGADFVVVSMHWGEEYQAQPTPPAARARTGPAGLGRGGPDPGHARARRPAVRADRRQARHLRPGQLPVQPVTHHGGLAAAGDPGGDGRPADPVPDEEGTVTSSMAYQPTRVEIPPEIVPGHVIRLVSPQNHPESWERTVAAVDLLGGCGAEPLDPSSSS